METLSVKDYCKQNKLVHFHPKVRVNTNGYPYITFMDENNVGNNLYFSKKGAETFTEGKQVTMQDLKQLQIGITTNAAGEQRVKLITNSERVELVFD